MDADLSEPERRVIGVPFPKGTSGNPGGMPRPVRAYRKAIHAQETPERVCAVVDAMRTQALAGGKGAHACARVYFEAVGLPLGKTDDDLADKLRDAPPEFLDYVEKLQQ